MTKLFLDADQQWPTKALFALVLVAIFLPFSALPPTQIGLWFQSEPVNVTLYGVTAILAFLLAHPALRQRVLAAWSHPAVWLTGAMFGWSLVVSPFSEFPIKSLQGNPETGQGALWFLSFFLWITGVIIAASTPLKKCVVTIALMAVTLGVVLFQNTQDDAAWFVVKWPDFQAFIGMFLTIILLALFGHKGRLMWLMAYGLGAALVIISESRAAYICYFGLMPLLAGFFWLAQAGTFSFLAYFKRHLHATAGVIMVLGVVMYVILCFPSEHYFNDDQANWLERGHAQFNFYYSSIGTRILFNKVAIDGMAENPTSWLTGFGWGHYADTLFRHVFIDEVSSAAILDKYGRDAPNWFMVKGTAFHSHNSFVEALHATGIIGLMLTLLFFAKVMPQLNTTPRVLIASCWIALATLFSFWFLLAIATLYFAVAAAFCVQLDMQEKASERVLRHGKWVSPFLLVCALGFITTTYTQYDLAIRGKAYSDGIQTMAPFQLGEFEGDYNQGGHHLWWMAASLVDFVQAKRDANIEIQPEWDRVEALRVEAEGPLMTLKETLETKEKALKAAKGNRRAALDAEVKALKAELAEKQKAYDAIVKSQPKLNTINVPDVDWYTYMLSQAEKLSLAGKANTKVRQLVLEGYSRIVTQEEEGAFEAARKVWEPKWRTIQWWYAMQEPERIDLLKYYYAHFINPLPEMKDLGKIKANLEEVFALLDPILEAYPNDPTAMWYSGMAMQYRVGMQDEAIRRMKRALDLRVDKHVRIRDDARAAIEAQYKALEGNAK